MLLNPSKVRKFHSKLWLFTLTGYSHPLGLQERSHLNHSWHHLPMTAVSSEEMVSEEKNKRQQWTCRYAKQMSRYGFWLTVNKTRAYILQLLLHVRILVNQLGYLLLQSLILLHEKLVHCGQFSVHGLEPRRLLPLLITAPNTTKEWTQNSARADKKNQHARDWQNQRQTTFWPFAQNSMEQTFRFAQHPHLGSFMLNFYGYHNSSVLLLPIASLRYIETKGFIKIHFLGDKFQQIC
jgi:hypothetical protein